MDQKDKKLLADSNIDINSFLLDNLNSLDMNQLDDILQNENNYSDNKKVEKQIKVVDDNAITLEEIEKLESSNVNLLKQKQQQIQFEEIYKKDPLEAVNSIEMQTACLDKKTIEYYQIEFPQIFGQQQTYIGNNQIKTISFTNIDYIKLYEKSKIKITTLYVGSGEVFLGTNSGEILRYKKEEDKPLVLYESSQKSPVTCMDIRQQFIVVGYLDGSINLFNLKKAQLSMQVKIHNTEVYFVKFFHDIYSADPLHEKEVEKITELSFLSCDSGELQKTIFSKGMLSGIKSSSENYPDLYSYYDIIKRSQKSREEVKIQNQDEMIFQKVINYKCQPISLKNITVLLQAFVTKDSIIILSESARTQPMIVFYEKRNNERFRDVDSDCIPVIDFHKDILMIGWGSIVYVVKLQLQFKQTTNNEQIVENQFPLKHRFYINQTNILYSSFIRNNIIFLIDNTNTCHIVNFLKFAKDQYKYNDNGGAEQSLNAHVFQSYNIQKITKSRQLQIDNRLIKSFYNSIQILNEKIYVLSLTTTNVEQQHQILEGEILQWEIQLNLKFDSRKDLASQIQTLEICLQIYQGKNQSFGEISTFKSDLKNYIARKVKESFERYLIDLINFRIKNSPQKIKMISDISEINTKPFVDIIGENVLEIVKQNNALMMYMKYLIFTDNVQFMFTEFLNRIRHVQLLKDSFFQSLEPYIVLEYIKFIPNEEIFKEFFTYFDSKNKHDIIAKFIFCIDKQQQLEYRYIKRLCNKLELLSASIFISTNFENNFKAPLQQMVSDLDSLSSSSSLQKSSDGSSQTNLIYTKEWIGYKLLWYIKRSLSSIVFPNTQMDDTQWSEAVNSIFEWIFFERNLIKILKIDPDLALQNILMFFKGYSSEFLKIKEQEYKQKFQKLLQYDDKINRNVQSDKNGNGEAIKIKDSLKTLICKYIKYVISQENTDKYLPKDTFNYFYLLLAEVKEKDVQIDQELSTEAIYFLLENPNSHFYRNKDWALEIEYRSKQIIKLIEPHISKNKLNLSEILRKALNSPFVEVCSYIYRYQGDFEQAIKIYLETSFVDIRFKIFSFIKELLDTNSEKQAQIIEKIFIHLPKLLAINYHYTKELLEKIQNYDIHAIIKALNGQEELTFKILSEYIHDQRKKIIEESLSIPQNEIYLYMLYMKLLIKFQPSEVVNELKTQLYSLEEVQQILKESNHLQGTAYVLSRFGNIKGALEIHLDLIKRYLNRKDKPHSIKEFTDGTELLLKNNKRGDEDSENNWFFWITGIQRIEQNIPKEMIEFQKKFEEESFEALIHNVQLSSILQNKDLLPLLGSNSSENFNQKSKLYETLQTLLKSYSFEQKIFEYSKDILYFEYCRKENVSFRLQKKGIKINFACSNCKKELQKDFTHYYCYHTYCSDCDKSLCLICFENQKNTFQNILNREEQKSINLKYQKYIQLEEEKKKKVQEDKEKKNNNNNNLNQKQIQEQKNAQEQQLQKNRKLKKLKNFDKNLQESRAEQLNFFE
ncbi:corvet complex core vacuolar protein (macronuclear) [Tetrahymena thermophila SB210]|uniref:Corvet complex core vacuolar protein n=1 Tax=Tetrahymena thermophila (strain SB210) TaxID=312017 RepID=I7M8M2_TETTS|nr:corvet complex core vacuolar protein [Tetrahymena thermophila SB210]EAR98443.2 corvet complex core vacuolar protein [Tetrahymena thermophila SB210]|eukprot:XP_001018688.2 corvet complex core vacuolar protein [Tetrahymena thermophila SB210]